MFVRSWLPMFKAMLGIPTRNRERAQWMFGNPVTFAEKPKPN